ncbi:MAG: response regulator transcription factor [Solirubrobacterales bacterium]
MSESEIRVFVVDDDEPTRTGMEELLTSVRIPVRSFASAEEFLDAYEPTWHGCLFLDIRMPGMGGLKLQDELIRRRSDLVIVFLTAYGDLPMAVKALKKGAADFVEKPIGDQELLDLTHEMLQRDARRQDRRETARLVREKLGSLTPRERLILEHVKLGKAPKMIAHELRLSRKTVDWHLSGLRGKLGVPSNEQLLLLLSKCDLLFETH